MNKLYIVKCMYKDTDLVLGQKSYWNRGEAIQAMQKLNSCADPWQFELIENNDCHMIWEGR